MVAAPCVRPAVTAKEQPVATTEVSRLWREDWSKLHVIVWLPSTA